MYISFLGEAFLGVLRAWLPTFRWAISCRVIVVVLLKASVTHWGFRQQYYRSVSASLPCKICVGSVGQRFSGMLCDAQLFKLPLVCPVGRNQLDPWLPICLPVGVLSKCLWLCTVKEFSLDGVTSNMDIENAALLSRMWLLLVNWSYHTTLGYPPVIH